MIFTTYAFCFYPGVLIVATENQKKYRVRSFAVSCSSKSSTNFEILFEKNLENVLMTSRHYAKIRWFWKCLYFIFISFHLFADNI